MIDGTKMLLTCATAALYSYVDFTDRTWLLHWLFKVSVMVSGGLAAGILVMIVTDSSLDSNVRLEPQHQSFIHGGPLIGRNSEKTGKEKNITARRYDLLRWVELFAPTFVSTFVCYALHEYMGYAFMLLFHALVMVLSLFRAHLVWLYVFRFPYSSGWMQTIGDFLGQHELRRPFEKFELTWTGAFNELVRELKSFRSAGGSGAGRKKKRGRRRMKRG